MASNITTIGKLTVLEDVPATIEFDRFGATSASMTFTAIWDLAPQAVLAQTVHPNFSWLKRDGARVSRMEANWARIEIQFKGIPPNTDEKFYKVSGATNTEPIVTHPDFGTFGTEENGAIFNADTGAFEGWTPESDFAGVENWLVPGLIYEELWVVATISSEKRIWAELGKVDTPPASSIRPPSPGDRNWLMFGGDVEKWGDGAKITRRWKLSGKSGWNETIYN